MKPLIYFLRYITSNVVELTFEYQDELDINSKRKYKPHYCGELTRLAAT